MKNYKIIRTCKFCYSTKLKIIFDLKKSPLCDEYLKKKTYQPFFPLKLMMCMRCKLSQINCVIDKNYIYKNYIYETKSSITLEEHFKNYCKKVVEFTKVKKNKDLIIDIGSNDGILLSQFKKKGFKVLGIEPARKIADQANKAGIKTLPNFLDKKTTNKILNKFEKAKIITINNLFANVDKINEFMQDVIKVLRKDGFLIIESSYLGEIIDKKIFDWIYHEHLSYFSILPIKNFMKKFKLKLVNIEKSKSKGGSYRYYFSFNSYHHNNRYLKKLILTENMMKLNTVSCFKKFKKDIDEIKINLQKKIKNNNYKNIAGFGASATSTTLISYFEINSFLKFLIDDNVKKLNTFSPGFHIPVKNYNYLKKKNIDTIIILAWRYSSILIPKIIKIKEKLNLNHLKKIIIPLPKVKIINL